MSFSIPKAIVVTVGLAFVAGAIGFGAARLHVATGEAPKELTGPATPAELAEKPKPEFVDVGQMVVPVLKAGKTQAFILSKLTLEAADSEAAAILKDRIPNARSVLLQTLYGLASSGAFENNDTDPKAVAETLKISLNDGMKSPLVKTVLIDRLLRQDNTRG